MPPICESVPEVAPGLLSPRRIIGLGACVCLAGAGFLFAVDPSQHAIYPQCQLFRLTGLFCAGCGITRAGHALLHGRVLEAIHDNLLFVVALPLILWIIGGYLAQTWTQNAWPEITVPEGRIIRWTVAVVAIMLTFTLLRNLPSPAFDWLRPLP